MLLRMEYNSEFMMPGWVINSAYNRTHSLQFLCRFVYQRLTVCATT